MSYERWLLACLVLGAIALGGCGGGETPVAGAYELTAADESAAEAITAELMRGHIAYLSSDDLEGRGPGSDGDAATAAYLGEQLGAIGFEPGGEDGGWLQPFELVGITATPPDHWSFSAAGGELTLAHWDEFIAASGVQIAEARIDDAEIVFVGYGIQAPEYDWDDFKGADLEGKILLMLNNDPDWDERLFAGTTRLYYGRWRYKYESAARQGAAGAIIIHTRPSAGYPFQVVQTSWTGEQFELPAGDEPRVQIEGWLTEDAARRVVALADLQLDELVTSARLREFEPVPLGVTTSLMLTNKVRRIETANVLGLLRGSDAELADEAVVYTAHHDHIGVGNPDADGDSIYNGALDNASGVAQLLAIASAFKQLDPPPRRSILMAMVAAEEQGLLGSEHYARHPTFPPGKLAANINYDGANIWGRTRDMTYIGFGKSSLDEIVVAVAARQDRIVKPDQFPDRGYFYRSDQFNFAKIGVPALYLDTGTDFVGRPEGWGKTQIEDYETHRYHQPADELDDGWSFDGMIEDARLGFWTGLIVANSDEPPSWNAGDEFEATRLEALAAAGP